MKLIRKLFYAVLFTLCTTAIARAGIDSVTCLGRVEPLGGVTLLAGPSGVPGGSVIAELNVKEGDWVEQGQIVAMMDDYNLRKAEVEMQKELVAEAEVNLKRLKSLSATQSISKAKLDEAIYNVRVLIARQKVYEARLEMATIKAPFRAMVLEINASPSEVVGPAGVMELGNTDQMSVIAEIYETDVNRVKPGQRVKITSPAFPGEVTGRVDSVGLKVGKMDVLNIDPISKTDARVVEATILLDESESLRMLTNLQVDVEITL